LRRSGNEQFALEVDRGQALARVGQSQAQYPCTQISALLCQLRGRSPA
jgi:hypothetical protein